MAAIVIFNSSEGGETLSGGFRPKDYGTRERAAFAQWKALGGAFRGLVDMRSRVGVGVGGRFSE